jgi:hypothetical protein
MEPWAGLRGTVCSCDAGGWGARVFIAFVMICSNKSINDGMNDGVSKLSRNEVFAQCGGAGPSVAICMDDGISGRRARNALIVR